MPVCLSDPTVSRADLSADKDKAPGLTPGRFSYVGLEFCPVSVILGIFVSHVLRLLRISFCRTLARTNTGGDIPSFPGGSYASRDWLVSGSLRSRAGETVFFRLEVSNLPLGLNCAYETVRWLATFSDPPF